MVYQNFSNAAEQILETARLLAASLGTSEVGTGLLLAAVVKDDQSSSSQIFLESGCTFDDVLESVKSVITIKPLTSPDADLVLSQPAHTALERARQQAKELKSETVTPEHILIALLPDKDAEALDRDDCTLALKHLGVNPDSVRSKLLNQLAPQETASTESKSLPMRVETPYLDTYARDMNKWWREGLSKPLVGRTKELNQVLEILCRLEKNNPVLVGEKGVGRAMLAEGVVALIEEGKAPEAIAGSRVMALNIGLLISGAKYRGELEERLNGIIKEAEAAKVIVVIENVTALIGAGKLGDGSIDAASLLTPAFEKGVLRCIGTATLDEYDKLVEDPSLSDVFAKVDVDEMEEEEAVAVLQSIKGRYEKHHALSYSDSALKAAASLAKRFITGYLPSKAITLLDGAGSRKRLQNPLAMDDLVVTENDVANLVSSDTGKPLDAVTEDEAERLLNMADALHDSIVGQEQAVEALANAIQRSRVDINDPNKPIGTFLFLGPTGVGKTELALALGRYMFLDDESVVRIDMSEFGDRYSISGLIGTTAGFVGYGDPGKLAAVRRKRYCVVLLDEWEKAHRDVWNLFLQAFDNGRITDGKGRTIDFRNTIIIMTSNVGADKLSRTGRGEIKYGDDKTSATSVLEMVDDNVKATFPPEFLNRIDEVIYFSYLNPEEIRQIVVLQTESLARRVLKNRGMTLTFSAEAIERLAKIGYEKAYGARPLKRAIKSQVETRLANAVLRGVFTTGDTIEVVCAESENDLELRHA